MTTIVHDVATFGPSCDPPVGVSERRVVDYIGPCSGILQRLVEFAKT